MPQILVGRSLVDRLGSAPDIVVEERLPMERLLRHLPVGLREVA